MTNSSSYHSEGGKVTALKVIVMVFFRRFSPLKEKYLILSLQS